MNALTADERFPLHWQMSSPERLTIIAILEKLKPKLSLEVGTYKGGSLQVLSHYSERVISIDNRPELDDELGAMFPNVDFFTGDSIELLPKLVTDLNTAGTCPTFILLDGAHATAGVRADIEAVIRLRPSAPSVILIHDSFHPECRAGIVGADWSSSPHVHEVETDYVSGWFNADAFDTAEAGSMWAGLACAVMRPEPRASTLKVLESQRAVFEAVLPFSVHARKRKGMRAMFGR